MPVRPIDDGWMSNLASTQATPVNVIDMEVAPDLVRPRIVLNQTLGTGQTATSFPYVIEIDPLGNRSTEPGGVAGAIDFTTPVPVQELSAAAGGEMVEVGVDGTVPQFPNGAEWSRGGSHASQFVYSMKNPAHPIPGSWDRVEMHRAEFNDGYGVWEEKGRLRFDNKADRYLVNCSYIDPEHVDEWLEDRLYFYEKQEAEGTAWNDTALHGAARWAFKEPHRSLRDQYIHSTPPPTGLNALASPVRPIPGAYAALVSRFEADRQGVFKLQLFWQDLLDKGTHGPQQANPSVHLIQQYDRVHGTGVAPVDQVRLLGTGAKRWRAMDDLGPGGRGFAYLLYAYFAGPVPSNPGVRNGWFDSFWVYFQGPLGGGINSPNRRFAADGLNPPAVHVSEAWRFVAVDPGNRFGYRYILDDESFYTNTGEPNAVFTFGALEPDGRDQESQIYVCSLSSAGSRNNTHDPLTQPPRVGAPTREILVSDETERLARFDAEPLTLHDFGGVYNERRTIIYYGAPWPFAPNNHRLRHADALV